MIFVVYLDHGGVFHPVAGLIILQISFWEGRVLSSQIE